jgi:hypothetical protein
MGSFTPPGTDGGLEPMSNQAAPKQDTTPGIILSAPWRLVEIEILSNYRLSVTFIDGTRGEVDLSRLLLSDHAGVFFQLRDPAIFANAYIESGAVTWPGEIDLAPDSMYDQIKQQGTWILE